MHEHLKDESATTDFRLGLYSAFRQTEYKPFAAVVCKKKMF